MRRIAIINQKGGVGKTTTAVNLGAALARVGQRVFVLDLDPQAHATTHLGIEPERQSPSMYDVLIDSRPLAEVRRLLMDCAPSLGVLTLNALVAANEVFIPLQPHFLALHGMGKLLETTALVSKRLNPGLRVTGIILCLYESTTRLAKEVLKDLQDHLDRSRSTTAPWAQARVFATRIRRNIKLAECPSFGQSIFAYASGCQGAQDYLALAREVLGESAAIQVSRVAVDETGHVHIVSRETQAALPQ
jgi:chromosome partitioning protein